MHLILSWLVLTGAVLVAAAIVPGMKVKGVSGALMTAGLFGLLNWALGGIFYFLIGVGTLGLGFVLAFITRWIVDAIVLKIADSMTDKVTVRSFGAALVAALVMSGVGSLGELLIRSF